MIMRQDYSAGIRSTAYVNPVVSFVRVLSRIQLPQDYRARYLG
jgi:hypothetical protein